MGTDISLYVEYQQHGATYAWSGGSINLERDHSIFRALAGVGGIDAPMFPPRGLPDDVSAEVFEQYYAFIINPADARRWSGFSWMSQADAAAYLESGECHAPPGSYVKYNMTSSLGYISLPGLIAASWLTTSEFARATEHAHLELYGDWAVLADLLAAIERRIPSAKPRIVFWFM